MKKSIQSVFLALVVLSVLSGGCAPAATPLPPTSTPLPTNTPIPPTVTPTATQTPTLTFVPSPTGTPVFPPIESFAGRWQNVDGNTTTSWAKIEITNNENTLSARFVLLCTLTEEWMLLHYPDEQICGEDAVSTRYAGNPVLLFSEHESSTTNFTLSLNGNTLHVTTFTDYTDNSGRADKTLEDDFRKVVPSFPVSEQIVFYHFVVGPLVHRRVPGGSVSTEVASDMGPVRLFPASSDEPHTADTAADLRTALELVLQHEANLWMSRDLDIVDVTFRDGHADLVLQGEYSGEDDEVLHAASMQILLTVFANPSVQTAAVTLNGDTLGNLGVSSSTNARPVDYVYTRAEMEMYLIEHAFLQP